MAIELKLGELNPQNPSTTAVNEDQWDWFNKYVERRTSPDDLVTSASTLILAGPALYSEINSVESAIISDSNRLSPVGFIINAQHAENQQVTRHREVGSFRSRFTVGKSAGQGQIARALFNADTLLRVLTKNASYANNTPHVTTFMKNSFNSEYGFSLASDAFKIPFGLAFVYKTIGNDFVGSEYLEQCVFTRYSISLDPGSPMVMENIVYEFDRARSVIIRVAGPLGMRDNNSNISG